MRRFFDHSTADIVFRYNNRLDSFVYHHMDSSLESFQQACLQAVGAFATLWLPNKIRGTVTSFDELQLPNEPHSEFTTQIVSADPLDIEAILSLDLEKTSARVSLSEPWGLSSLSSGLEGRNRIAVPTGADWSEPWILVCPDDFGPRTYTVEEAPEKFGMRTFWLSVLDADQGSHFRLEVEWIGRAEIQTSLGPTFFEPGNDPRPASTLLRGVPTSDWHASAASLYSGMVEQLANIGWSRQAK